MKGRGGMGTQKHRKSGHSGKSPKLRMAMRRDAEKNERKAPARGMDTVSHLFEIRNRPS